MELPAKVSHWLSTLTAKSNRIWLTPAIWSILAVVFALLASWLGRVVPEVWVPEIELDTLEGLLDVVASSMLAVTTFSLSIMVGAFANAASSTTPRATTVVMSDEVTHAAIASFLSAFVYAVIAKTALGLGYYGNAGRLVLLIGTVIVLGWLIVMLIRWVKALSSLGLVSNTLDKLERQARQTLEEHRDDPALGFTLGRRPTTGTPLYPGEVGYLVRISPSAVRAWAVDNDARVHICRRPGSLLDPARPLAVVDGTVDDDALDRLRACFHIGAERSYQQDPRYGLIALSEVAERALSAAVNDPGTAIQVLARVARVLISTAEGDTAQAGSTPRSENEKQEEGRGRVTIDELSDDELVREAFESIARDGSGLAEIHIRLQKTLAIIARNGTPAMAQEARSQSRLAMERAREKIPTAHELERILSAHSAAWASP